MTVVDLLKTLKGIYMLSIVVFLVQRTFYSTKLAKRGSRGAARAAK